MRTLGAAALALGLAAPLAGERGHVASADAESPASSARDLRVTALQVARWIRDRKPGLRVLDLRPPAAFGEGSIPTAENIPRDQLANARFAPNETVVVYAERGADAADAARALRTRGVAAARFLPDGLADWRDEVMQPLLQAGASPQAIADLTQVSLYFGGSPHTGGAASTADAAQDLSALRRRGC